MMEFNFSVQIPCFFSKKTLSQMKTALNLGFIFYWNNFFRQVSIDHGQKWKDFVLLFYTFMMLPPNFKK